MKKIIRTIVFIISVTFLLLLFLNIWIVSSTDDRIFQSLEDVPGNRVGLVLGTSKSVKGGENIYFKERVDAAADLFHNGKITHILVSGDNRTKYYNEPQDMYKALKSRGVPDSSITLDFAGFRTLDSVVRCIRIFGQTRFTIITQRFHGHRTLFIADYHRAEAVVFAASGPEIVNQKVSLRELVARQLAVFDLYILNKQPKFLGEKEPL